MTRFRNYAAVGLVSALAAACGISGGNSGNGQVAGYPASYSPRHANIQERVASRYDEQTIIQAQRALGDKGFDVGAIDGIWGPSSQSALRNFQEANGMAPDGRLGPEVLAALGASSGQTAGTRQFPEGRASAPATDGTAPSAADREAGMRGGSGTSAAARADSDHTARQAGNEQGIATRYDRETIRQAQRALGRKGFDVGPIDGIWGPASRRALENFQQVKGMDANGRLGPEVMAALDLERSGAGEREATTAAETEGKVASGNRDLEAFYDTRTVLDVQRTLADRGFEVDRVDGVWGPKSQSALRNFQKHEGLEASGRINAPTLAALDIAPAAGERPEGTRR